MFKPQLKSETTAPPFPLELSLELRIALTKLALDFFLLSLVCLRDYENLSTELIAFRPEGFDQLIKCNIKLVAEF